MNIIELNNVDIIFPTVKKSESIKKKIFNFLRYKKSSNYGLKNINLKISDGDKIGIIGTNGSGKTTLLKTISGILPYSRGEIIINGKIVSIFSVHTLFFGELSGLENIKLFKSYFNSYDFDQQNLYEKVLELSELGENILKPVRTYSSGMISRLSMSLYYMLKGDILISDEFITTGDPKFTKKITNLFLEKYKSKTVIIASHNHEFLKSFSNKIIEISNGKISKIFPTEKL